MFSPSKIPHKQLMCLRRVTTKTAGSKASRDPWMFACDFQNQTLSHTTISFQSIHQDGLCCSVVIRKRPALTSWAERESSSCTNASTTPIYSITNGLGGIYKPLLPDPRPTPIPCIFSKQVEREGCLSCSAQISRPKASYLLFLPENVLSMYVESNQVSSCLCPPAPSKKDTGICYEQFEKMYWHGLWYPGDVQNNILSSPRVQAKSQRYTCPVRRIASTQSHVTRLSRAHIKSPQSLSPDFTSNIGVL